MVNSNISSLLFAFSLPLSNYKASVLGNYRKYRYQLCISTLP